MINNKGDITGSLFEDDSDVRESPSIHIGQNGLEAHLIVPERPLQVDIRVLLSELDIIFGIDSELVEEINKKLYDNKKLDRKYLIAKGVRPVYGQPGELILRTKKPEDVVLSSEDLTKVDYKIYKRKMLALAEKERPVAMIIDPTKGHDGMDVFGNVIKGEDGAEVNLVLGENAYRSGKKLISKIDGLIEYNKTADDTIYFDISEIYIVKGDVDYNTGNVDFPGSVIVKGIVKAGFEVKAKNEVVAETIRGRVIAGGSVTAKQGIIGSVQNAEIQAGGDVTAKFAQNATIIAEGAVEIKKSIVMSDIYSEDTVTVEGSPGSIIGGRIFAVKGIDAKVLGSESFVKTEVAIYQSAKDVILLRDIIAKRFEVNKNLMRIDTYLGQGREMLFKGIKGDKQELIAKLVKKREMLRRELLELNTELRSVQNVLISPMDSTVNVGKIAWPEVRISISGKFILLKNERGKGRYFYNKADDTLDFR
jgi:uncharacterized protein (DUF342 family)